MKRLRRAYERRNKKTRKFKKRAIAAGTAAVITLGAGITMNKALAFPFPRARDRHQLSVPQDADFDLLSNREELAIGYLPFDPDQNGNQIPDGVDLGKRCAAIVGQLTFGPHPTDPQKPYIERVGQFGLETCDICGQTVNMGPASIVNPKLGLSVECPLIAMHYMDHGSFSYTGDVHNGRLDVPALLRALDLPVPDTPPNHQLPVGNDTDGDLLANAEELAIGYLPFDRDQNRNQMPDGVELAERCAAAIAELPHYFVWDDPPNGDEPYKICHEVDGVEQCDVCGEWIHMGGCEIINPKLGLRYPAPDDPLAGLFLPDLALHYMQHGSFDCYGSIHVGRVDVDRLMRVLELRFACDPNEHQLPLDYSVEPVGQLAPDANDHDGDLLADSEELGAGLNLYDADQDDDLTPDGVELAKQCSQVIDHLPIYDPRTDMPIPYEPFKINYFQKGLELCEICGQTVNMGFWKIVNPKLERSMDVYDITCHYMSHGSFSYSGQQISPPHEPFHNGRANIALLADILEMPRRCSHLGTMYLPGDFNKDCKVNFKDFAQIADEWLQDTYPDWVAQPGMTYRIEDCGEETQRPLTAQRSGEERFTVTTAGIYIHFQDIMVANCCPEYVQLKMQIDGNKITISETEYTPHPCRCICDYPVTATIGPLEAGTYTLEVYEDWGGFIGSATVTIGAGR